MSLPEKIRALEAIHREGTIHGAARQIGKSPSAVNYLVNALEEEAGVPLLDRSAYRNRLNPAGLEVLAFGRRLLNAEEEVGRLFGRLRGGSEPRLHLIYDGAVSFSLISQAMESLRRDGVGTRILATAAFHEQVEREFLASGADMMITVAPVREVNLPFVQLSPIRLFLVVSPMHPLGDKSHRAQLSDLKSHSLINVRGSSLSLGLSTGPIEPDASLSVGDFAAKKALIERGLGYGWLPEHMIEAELASGRLVKVNSEFLPEHLLVPRLYHRPEEELGRTARLLREGFLRGYAAPCRWEGAPAGA